MAIEYTGCCIVRVIPKEGLSGLESARLSFSVLQQRSKDLLLCGMAHVLPWQKLCGHYCRHCPGVFSHEIVIMSCWQFMLPRSSELSLTPNKEILWNPLIRVAIITGFCRDKTLWTPHINEFSFRNLSTWKARSQYRAKIAQKVKTLTGCQIDKGSRTLSIPKCPKKIFIFGMCKNTSVPHTSTIPYISSQ